MRIGVERKLRINYEEIRDKLKHDREIAKRCCPQLQLRSNSLQFFERKCLSRKGVKLQNDYIKDLSNTMKKVEEEQWRYNR